MKTKNVIFVFGAALLVSFGVFSSTKNYQVAEAEEIIDVGEVVISEVRNTISVNRDIYLLPTEEIALPDDWDHAYKPVGEDSGVYVNNVKDTKAEIKHAGTGSEYVTFYYGLRKKPVSGDIVTFKGTWYLTLSEVTYQFTFKEFSIIRNSTSWEENKPTPDLVAYDEISLADTCFDDKDREAFDSTHLKPCAWNTYVPSSENITNSFAFNFVFEAYDKMTNGLNIKVGNSGPYDEGHYYKFALNNTWGTKGVILFQEYYGTSIKSTSGDINCDLQPGKRHTIEFGSIYLLKESDKTFNYVKFDGEIVYKKTVAPYNNYGRTTKVGYYYPGKEIFIGSTTKQKENTQILRLNSLSEDRKGIYLDATINDIPSGWEIKGAPASKYNALINGKPMYQFGTSTYPLTKCGADEEASYYLDLELANISLKEGDIVTLSDEFHFYVDDKAYTMSVIPTSFLYSKNQLTQIKNIKSYLYNKVANYANPMDYEEDELILISQIVESSEAALNNAISMKELWELYYDYLAQIDEVPYKESKQQEILIAAKEKAKAELNAFINPDRYKSSDLEIVEGYVDKAIEDIESAETVIDVEQIVNNTLALIEPIPTKQQAIENEIIAADKIEDIFMYLEDYEVVTTTDLCASGDMVFGSTNESTYHSGGYDDTTTRIATSSENTKGNMIFQFTYESDNPAARIKDSRGNEFGAQIFIRLRGTDSNAYRFDFATITGDSDNSGVALTTLKNDVSIGRITYNAKLQPDTPYTFECGAIDLDGYNRTLLFLNLDGETVIKTIVDSIDETRPTIAIRDSYVADPFKAALSAVEKGTTKERYHSSLIGKLELDTSSDKDFILASLRDNEIPVDSELYAVKSGSFKLNDQEIEMINSRPGAVIRKTGQNKYVIDIQDHEYVDGETIYIGGYFGVFNSNTMEKTIYRLQDSTFIYHSETNSWSQETPTNQKIVEEAKETIKYYANLSNYSLESIEKIEALVTKYTEKIDNVKESEIPFVVPTIVDEALGKIDEIRTLLEEYKAYSIKELEEYRSPSEYRDEEKIELMEILESASSEINSCTDYASINQTVVNAKNKIDQLKTKSQRDEEDLIDAKKAAYNEIITVSGYIELDRYTEENANRLIELTHIAIDEWINDATNVDEVNIALETFNNEVKNIETKDGTIFDGHNYIVPSSGGCGGSISTVSMLSFVALFAAAILIFVKKLKEFN